MKAEGTVGAPTCFVLHVNSTVDFGSYSLFFFLFFFFFLGSAFSWMHNLCRHVRGLAARKVKVDPTKDSSIHRNDCGICNHDDNRPIE
jgi:hypothetical protein